MSHWYRVREEERGDIEELKELRERRKRGEPLSYRPGSRANTWCYPYYGLPPPAGASLSTVPSGEAREQLLQEIQGLEDSPPNLCALFNAGAPVNKLPNELLGEVFAHLQGDADDPNHFFFGWSTALLVCRRWRAVGVSTPSLWRVIRAREMPDYLHMRTSLARSGQTKLTVLFQKLPAFGCARRMFIERLAPHLHRIRTLLVSATYLPYFLAREMPSLETLLVSPSCKSERPSYGMERGPTVFHVQREHFPKLRRMGGYDLHLKDYGILHQLTRFDLQHSDLASGVIQARRLAKMLKALVNVEHLSLRELEVRSPDSHSKAAPASKRVLLSKLRTAEIQCTARDLRLVLSTVEFPASADVRISVRERFPHLDRSESCERVLRRSHRAALPILSRLTHLRVEVHHLTRLTLEGSCYPPPAPDSDLPADTDGGRGGRLQFTLDLGPGDHSTLRSYLEGLLDLCSAAPVEVLHVVADVDARLRLAWLGSVLAPFAGLRELTVTCSPGRRVDTQDAANLFQKLGAGASQIAGTVEDERILCPRLDKLCVVGLNVTEDNELRKLASECIERRRALLNTGDDSAAFSVELRDEGPRGDDAGSDVEDVNSLTLLGRNH